MGWWMGWGVGYSGLVRLIRSSCVRAVRLEAATWESCRRGAAKAEYLLGG